MLLINLNEKISEFGSVFFPSFAQRLVGSVAQTALWDGQTLSAHNELVELVFEPLLFIELTVGQLVGLSVYDITFLAHRGSSRSPVVYVDVAEMSPWSKTGNVSKGPDV